MVSQAFLCQPSASRTGITFAYDPSTKVLGYYHSFRFADLRSQMRNTQHSLARLGLIIVVLHFLVSMVHGAAHVNLHITLNNWQTVYVLVVITVLPLVSGVLLWRRMRGGFLLLFCSMIGSLLFGGYYHFIAAGADNVSSLGAHTWSMPFQLTAVLLALTEVAGAVTAVLGLLRKQ